VHEHDAIQELDLAPFAGFQHVTQLGRIVGARLFANNVFAGGSRALHPFLSQTGGQWNVDRVDVPGTQQLLVRTERPGNGGHGRASLAGLNELTRALLVAAGNGNHHRIACIQDRQPVFAGNIRGAENTPAQFVRLVRNIFRGSV
jgi:hypothetical protein